MFLIADCELSQERIIEEINKVNFYHLLEVHGAVLSLLHLEER